MNHSILLIETQICIVKCISYEVPAILKIFCLLINHTILFILCYFLISIMQTKFPKVIDSCFSTYFYSILLIFFYYQWIDTYFHFVYR